VIETTFPTQSRFAQFRASSFDAVDNTIELTFATSTPVRRRSSYGDYYDEVLTISADAIDISRIDAGSVPLLNSHRIESLADVVGNILPNTVRIATGAASVRAKLSTARGDADVVTKVRDGVITSCSVGYAINQFNIEDRAGDVPVRRITKWTVLEISLVATPADPFAKIRGGELYGAALQAMPRKRAEFVCEPFEHVVIPR
jgi:HK97 family phage prohead protease